MAEFKVMLGKGLQFLVITLSVCLLLALGFGAGTIYHKLEQEESNVEVMSNDSEVAVEISNETKRLLKETKNELKDIDIVTSDGRFSAEFMQRLQSAKSDAEQRGDQAVLIRRLTRQ